MILQARIRYETLLVPKPGMYVIYMGEHNPGKVYQIKRCWTNDTYVDLVNRELIYCKEIMSVPLRECIIPWAEIEFDAGKNEINKEGFFKKYQVFKFKFSPEDYQQIADLKLEDQMVDVVTLNDHFKQKDQTTEVILFQPTIKLRCIPVKYHQSVITLIQEVCQEAYNAGLQNQNTDDWLVKVINKI